MSVMDNLRTGQAGIVSGNILGEALTQAIAEAGPKMLFKSCASCKHMQRGPAFCQLHKATPPADVIVSGCAQYIDIQDSDPMGLDADVPF